MLMPAMELNITQENNKKSKRYKTRSDDFNVAVNILSQIIFFLLFLGMVMYPNEGETKQKQKLPEIKN